MDRDPAGTGGLNPGRPATGRIIVPAAAVAILALLAAADLWRLCRSHPSLPLWDEAAHGYAGVQVADALRHFNPLELLLALNRQVVWPFVHSLLLAPALLLGGNGFAAAEAASLALYALTALALFLAGSLLHPTRGALVGLAAASLALLAPSYRLFGTLAMLEIPGALLLALAFALHARAAREPLVPGHVRAAGFATTALFLCKYNYGLLWLLPLALWEWRLLAEGFRARARAAIRRRMTARWWLRPVPALLAAGAIAIATILATGGGEFRLFGQRVSVRSPGNLAYALWLAGLIWLFAPRRGLENRGAWIWARLPERARILVQAIGIPLAIWFTLPYPNRMKEFFGFIANRDSAASLWSVDGLLFYPRAFAADYSPAAWVAWIVIALAIASPLAMLVHGRSARHAGDDAHAEPGRIDGARHAARLAGLALAAGLAATMLHRYRDGRFLFTVCPLLWLCAAHAAVTLVDTVLRRFPGRYLPDAIGSAAAAMLITSVWLFAPSDSDVLARRAAFRGPASTGPAIDEVLDTIAPRPVAPDYSIAANPPGGVASGVIPAAFVPAARIDPNRDYPARAILLGYGNVLSPGLLAWQARLSRPDLPRAAYPRRAPFVAAGAEDVALEARARWIEERADVVVVALAESLPGPLAADYRNETWADRETAGRLGGSNNWARVSTRRIERWRVETYRPSR